MPPSHTDQTKNSPTLFGTACLLVAQRRQRLERQSQRLVDAYQAEAIALSEFQFWRQKLTTELQRLDRELQQLAHTQQQTLHWQAVIDHVDHFRQK